MVWVSCPSMRSRKICRGIKVSLMSTQISENRKISNSGQLWASDRRIFRRFPVLTHNFHSHMTRRAPSCIGFLRALRVIRRRGQTGPNREPDSKVIFRDVWWIFSRSCYSFWTGIFFPKLQALICRMVSVSCPSMLSRKSCWCFKLTLMSTEISENRKISKSGQIWASDGRMFRQCPVLTHNFHQTVTRRAPSCTNTKVLRSNTGWPGS